VGWEARATNKATSGDIRGVLKKQKPWKSLTSKAFSSGADGSRTRDLLRDRKVPPVATFTKILEIRAILPMAPFDFAVLMGAVECIVERNFSDAFERDGLRVQKEEWPLLSREKA
jgi:hypothetical protein